MYMFMREGPMEWYAFLTQIQTNRIEDIWALRECKCYRLSFYVVFMYVSIQFRAINLDGRY